MPHLTPDELRAFLDGELAPPAEAGARTHLAACAACVGELEAVRARAQRIGARLAHLAPAATPPARQAMAQLRRRSKEKDGFLMRKGFLTRRSVWAGAAAVLALALAFTFPPVRTWAGQFLGLFRVQQVTVLPVDMESLSALDDNPTLAELIGQVFSESVKVTREPQDVATVSSAAEASQAAGFAVRELAGHTPTRWSVASGAAFEITINRDQAQGLINEAGRSDLQLPASIDGAVISVDVPTGVAAGYGDCDRPGAFDRDPGDPDDRASRGSCFLLSQVPSPSVSAPPDVDVAALAELGLQFTGFTAEEAREISQSIDWTSTLVVPIPRDAAHAQAVSVDGVTGQLVTRVQDDRAVQQFALLWVKDGVIYSLTGVGSPAEALALAEAIQ